MQPLVSIIIPTYNRAHLITETLNSILAQGYQNWECLVIDDGSTDDTEQVVLTYCDKDQRIFFYHRPSSKPKGANACRNFGFSQSKGAIVNWLDSDDLLLENHLEIHVAGHAHAAAAIVTSASVFRDSTGNVVRQWDNTNAQHNIITEMIYNHVLWPINCVSWKRDSIPDNPFAEELASSQEWTFHLSQIISGVSYKVHPEATCLVREHSARTGKLVSVQKSYSTFTSRCKIFHLLEQKSMLDKAAERGLLKYIFIALRQSLAFNYRSLTISILRFLVANLARSKNRNDIAKVLFLSVPIYFTTGKGEKLFRLKAA